MTNTIVFLVLLLILGAAIRYIIKAKKSGVKCIGCPNANQCKAAGTTGCSCHTENNCNIP